MKAVVYKEYGSAEKLKLVEIEKPSPKDDEVLIEVRAASPNASDCEFLKGSPLYVRMWGLFKPKHEILGSDVAGIVAAVGKNVQKFNVGDEVFGDVFLSWGGFAEYVCAPENTLMHKPSGLSFEVAAVLPQASTVALQGLRDEGHIESGQKVLINGAGGGCGMFAIQLAKLFGAEVTGVDSTEKLSTIRSFGADHVIDYRKTDFTKNGQQYDLVLDMVAAHSVFAYRRSLSPKGRYIMVGGFLKHLFQTLIFGSLISLTSSRNMGILGHKPNKDLAYIIDLVEKGKITPFIERRYSLSEVPDAMLHLSEGHAKGKLLITI